MREITGKQRRRGREDEATCTGETRRLLLIGIMCVSLCNARDSCVYMFVCEYVCMQDHNGCFGRYLISVYWFQLL